MASLTGMMKSPPPLTAASPLSSSSSAYLRGWVTLAVSGGGGGGGGVMSPAGLVVECSSRPQKKATAHHRKTRPKKSQPWDIRRKGPTAYPPLPALPPDWTVVAGDEPEVVVEEVEESVAASV